MDDYFLENFNSEKCKKLDIGQKNLTIMEGITIYHFLGNKKSEKVLDCVWLDIENMKSLPGRSFECVKEFWER
jgi:hypothetical protein